MPTNWTSSVVIQPDTIASDGGEGPFRAIGSNGAAPPSNSDGNVLGTYFVLALGTGQVVFQGGGISIY